MKPGDLVVCDRTMLDIALRHCVVRDRHDTLQFSGVYMTNKEVGLIIATYRGPSSEEVFILLEQGRMGWTFRGAVEKVKRV